MQPRTIVRLFTALFAFVLLVVAVTRAAEPTGTVHAAHLRCEYATDPLGIDVPQPRLSWRVEGDGRGLRQTAWQILVASSEELLAQDRGDLWDSQRQESDDSINIRYAGAPLASSQQIFWKVRLSDNAGVVGHWSAPARWTMGMLAPNEWRGIWIVAPAETETLLLRHEFDVKRRLLRAVAHVCGLGEYEMRLNGAKVGEDILSPGWTDYENTVLYDTHDVTTLLREGHNAVGLELGNGMYRVVRRNRFVKFTGSFGALRALLHLRLEYADGSVEFVGTNEQWRTLAGPTIFSNIYGGEDFDARLGPRDWDKAGFDDSPWARAVAIIRPAGTLRGHTFAAEPLRAIEVRQPVEVRPLARPGTVIYDFGQNTAMMPRLRVSGPAGSTVRLTPGEVINDDGTINRGTMGGTGRGGSWWQFTKATDAEEKWAPKFCYIGSRYVQAELMAPGSGDTPAAETKPTGDKSASAPVGQVPNIASLEQVIVHSSAAPIGEFACSNPLLNRIRDLVRWAQRSNMVSVLTDCPHREKLGWLEQYHLNGPSIRYEFDVTRIFAKGMNDMADSQLDTGLIPNIAPEYTKFQGTFRAAAEWGAAFMLVPWQQYEFTGDLDLFRTHFDAMKRYFTYLESRATDDILSEGLGDWYDLGPKRPGAAQLTPPPVTATAFYFHDAQTLARAAELLGKKDDARTFSEKAERIRAKFNERFFDREAGAYAGSTQCASALPLVMYIVEPRDRERVLDALVRDVEAHGYATTAGDVGFRYVLRALADGGRSDVIYRMINQDEKPGYGFQLKRGATSLTESWDANLNSSHNHFMLGQVTEWLYKDLAGIDGDPSGPGFRKIIIRPNPVGDLTWVRASYDSVRGRIVSEWAREEQRLTMRVTIPTNTTATVFVPAKSAERVSESGKPASRSEGVKFLQQDGDRAVFAVGSGEYEFASEM